MAGSRRRTRRMRTNKTRVGVRKVAAQQKARAPVPVELKFAAADAAAAAGPATPPPLAGGKLAAPAWNVAAPPARNYAAAGLAVNPNKRTGRNAPTGGAGIEAKAAAIAAGTLPYTASDDDDDLRAAEGKPRLDGSRRTPHAALTATQASVVARLVAAHGEDVGAMARDTKLNRMLLPPSKLRVLLEAWKAAGAASEGGGMRCRFAQPVKSLKGRRPF